MMNESFFASLKNYRYSHESARYGFGDRQTQNTGSGIEFEDYRSYIPGDDMRLLDWNVYSRLDQLYVKRYKSSGGLKITIILDRSASMVVDPFKMTSAVKLASALGFVGLNNSDTVRILPMPCLNENEVQTYISKKQLQTMVDSLEKIRIVRAEKHSKSLKFAYSGNERSSLSLIISDFQEEQSWFKFVNFLKGNHQRVFAFHILSEKELELPDEGHDISLRSVEFAEKHKIEVTNSLKVAFLTKFKEYLQRTNAFMHSNRVGYIKIASDARLNGHFWQKLKNLGLWS